MGRAFESRPGYKERIRSSGPSFYFLIVLGAGLLEEVLSKGLRKSCAIMYELLHGRLGSIEMLAEPDLHFICDGK